MRRLWAIGCLALTAQPVLAQSAMSVFTCEAREICKTDGRCQKGDDTHMALGLLVERDGRERIFVNGPLKKQSGGGGFFETDKVKSGKDRVRLLYTHDKGWVAFVSRDDDAPMGFRSKGPRTVRYDCRQEMF